MPFDAIPDYLHLGDPTRALVEEIRTEKYMQPGDGSWDGTCSRLACAIFSGEPELAGRFATHLHRGLACPGGRVWAGAGTNKYVTWINCFVAPLLQDSMRTDPDRPGRGIMDALAAVAFSMQMGAGVGTDFSPLRPAGARVLRVMAAASGPLAFMDMWDGMCRTIMSAGYRRGAMMATLRCDHPDLLEFISAKHDGARLRMFNVSVLVTDAFMQAVDADLPWELGHWEPPLDHARLVRRSSRLDERTGTVREWFVYREVSAREVWRTLMESTYRHAEPGIIFIDRINRWNNLGYCEYISCTNPCGEQPLPPDQNCNLAHNNLTRCISGTPFTDDCTVDYDALEDSTRLLVRVSDNVIDLSPFPTEEQLAEAQSKRRIGLGVTGLANLLMFLRQRYGSPGALDTIHRVMSFVRNVAYEESIRLAEERGPFPAFDRDAYLMRPFIHDLPEHLRDGIAKHGIRNALLLTVAPTGTVSIAQGLNCSGGLEPVFAATYKRKKLEADGSYSEHVIEDLGFRVYANALFDGDMVAALAASRPDYMVTTAELTPEDHLHTQATVQRYIDSAVSKTINLPTEISFEDFAGVYRRAYELGCKGCTTYREDPDSGRGAVLTAIEEVQELAQEVRLTLDGAVPPRERPEVLHGRTYRLRWSALPYPMYLTVNDEIKPDGSRVPFEVFINSKAVDNEEWTRALTRMISSVMRKGGDLAFIPDELKQVWSASGGEYVQQRYVPSVVALIGYTLERHFREIGYLPMPAEPATLPAGSEVTAIAAPAGRQCRACGERAVVKREGCDSCTACGWSNCG